MKISAKAWKNERAPKRILAIRLQAIGDTVITLPYLQYLKDHLPKDTVLDLLTRDESNDIPKSIYLFNNIYSIGGGRSLKKQLLYTALLLPGLLLKRYDIVIDLQNNEVSNLVRRSLLPKAWSSFDRFSAMAAGERTRLTIEAVGLGECAANTSFKLKNDDSINSLKINGWDNDRELIALNPAGAFKNRNWPMDNYIRFVELWLEKFPTAQFIILGTNFIKEKASYLKNKLGDRLIDLVGKTTAAQAFAILQRTRFVLSEDSGLMHMAWVSGIPTIALFGSTRSDWAQPLGKHTSFFDSSGLECGNCMQPACKYGDDHCMTGITPAMVFEKAVKLMYDQSHLFFDDSIEKNVYDINDQ